MRHRYKKSVLMNTGIVKQKTVLRNLLTSLVVHGSIETTPSRARALKAYADGFFSRLVKRVNTLSEADASRENIREVKSVLFTEEAGKKMINDLLPQLVSRGTSSYVSNHKAGLRSGDATTKVIVSIA